MHARAWLIGPEKSKGRRAGHRQRHFRCTKYMEGTSKGNPGLPFWLVETTQGFKVSGADTEVFATDQAAASRLRAAGVAVATVVYG